jgi:hypothetical protein
MGTLVDFKLPITVEIRRFGHVFTATYDYGPKPSLSAPEAKFFIDGSVVSYLKATYDKDVWTEWYLEPGDLEQPLILPEVLGMSEDTRNQEDLEFLFTAEVYILDALTSKVITTIGRLNTSKPTDAPGAQVVSPRIVSPRDRGHRVTQAFHDSGKNISLLPQIVAIEVADAIDCMGFLLSEYIDEEQKDKGGAFQCGECVRDCIVDLLDAWNTETSDETEKSDQ